MNTIRLIYASKFAPGIGTPEIEDILARSREHNKQWDVTGLLCYAPGVFLQCLEGPRKVVNNLYRAIAKDPRHKDPTLLEYSDITERIFGKWSMAYVRMDDLGEIQPQVPAAGEKFDPFEMTAGEALDFVTAIAKKRQDLLESTADDSA